MKKLLLASVAVSGLAFAAAPAHAGLDLSVSGYFKGYGAFVDQDEDTGDDVVGFDLLRDTELHVNFETTLDNGLTVGAYVELAVDAADASEIPNESYAYFSGNWGRLNIGYEDGVGYLLQVAAPSADSNIDGIRQYIQPFADTGNMGALGTVDLDYEMITGNGKNDKISYLSPIVNGFQLGVSFTPDNGPADDREGVAIDDDTAGDIQETYEIAVRYEGQFQNVGVIAGAGYTTGSEEGSSATTDDRNAWNVGLDLDIGPFGVGAVYTTDNLGLNGTAEADRDVIVVGVDYTTGPFKFGASYYNQDNDNDTADYDRYTGGVIYEYGPGMTFRGSIQFLDVKRIKGSFGDNGADGTAVLLGTQVNF